MKNAVNIYLLPGPHPVISAIAPELASRFAHILTEPFPENITALLQRIDARLSAEPANLPCDRRDHPHQAGRAGSIAAMQRAVTMRWRILERRGARTIIPKSDGLT
jgi:hypothetical protein